MWRDDFSEPTTWQVVADETGTTAYDETNGRLSMSVTADRASVWDDHRLDRAYPVPARRGLGEVYVAPAPGALPDAGG